MITRGPLPHYVFTDRPNLAKAELPLGTRIAGLTMEHVTIQATRDQYRNPLIQDWICDNVLTHVTKNASVVIVLLGSEML